MAKAAVPATVTQAPPPTVTQPTTTKGVQALAIVPPQSVAVYEDVDVVEGAQKEEKRELPILRILQPLSPQVMDPDHGGIPGAKAGDFFNIQTNEVFPGKRGMYMVAVNTHRKFVEYIARDRDGKGGGFLNVFEPENPIVSAAEDAYRRAKGLDAGRRIFDKIPNGVTTEEEGGTAGKPKQLVDSRYIDGIFVVPNEDGSFPGHFGQWFRGSLAFQSSFLRSWDSWDVRRRTWLYPVTRNGRVEQVLPQMWTTVVHVRSTLKQDGDRRWYVPMITLAAKDEEGKELDHKASRLAKTLYDADGRPFDNPLYQQAVDLSVEIAEGAVTLDFSKDRGADDGGTGGGGEQQRPAANKAGDDIPFE